MPPTIRGAIVGLKLKSLAEFGSVGAIQGSSRRSSWSSSAERCAVVGGLTTSAAARRLRVDAAREAYRDRRLGVVGRRRGSGSNDANVNASLERSSCRMGTRGRAKGRDIGTASEP